MIRNSIACLIGIWITLICLSACGKEEETEQKKQEVIKIPVTFLVNPDTGQNENENLVKEFNKAYEGTYRVEVEWLTDTAEGYRSTIKALNGLDRLPAVITDVGFDDDFYQLLIENNRLVDLWPYMEADGAWTEALNEKVIEVCREEDGNMYLAPIGTFGHSYAGFFYNKQLFSTAGIETFPDTWDGFWECLETLEAHHIPALALNGGSSYWTPLLIATNYMAGSEEGMEFLNVQYPDNYENDCVKDMFSMLKRLYDYAQADVFDMERSEAAQSFIEGEIAIVANGGWMLGTFPSETKERTGFAPFPGNILMQDPKTTAWAVTAGYEENVTRGAIEFLKFRAIKESESEMDFLNSTDSSPAEQEYKAVVRSAERITPNYQLKWEDAIQNDFMVNHLPAYIRGEVSLEEFLVAMNEGVREIDAEK